MERAADLHTPSLILLPASTLLPLLLCAPTSPPQIAYLTTIGLQQDEICNMASISVVLLGLNPDTRLRPVVEYIQSRGVPADSVADLVLRHPRIFEYKVWARGGGWVGWVGGWWVGV
jgi:hypothetical protein